MKAVIAIDSMKGSLSSLEAGEAAARGIRRVYPDAEILLKPLADGGEGTVEALALDLGGEIRKLTVCGPLGKPVDCAYGIVKELNTAIIEMSGAAGITLISEKERDPLYTTTYGVGQVIRACIDDGVRNFIVGIGGSATNDGGAGMLQALGFDLMDENGDPIPAGARGLKLLSQIDDSNVPEALRECRFNIACDVTNPLCGDKGCSAIFGPQKGATPETIKIMDEWLGRFAEIAAKKYPAADASYPGTGAAGGLGFAFLTFTNARLQSGVSLVLEATRLEECIKDADIVITGEGRLDAQTVMGKAPAGVAELAKRYGKKVIAFAGCVTNDARECNDKGIDAFFPILRTVVPPETAMEKTEAGNNLTDTAEQVFRLIKLFSK